MIQKGNYFTCDQGTCFSVDSSFTCAHASHNDVVLEILETPKEKQFRAMGQIASDRAHWEYVRIRRQEEYDFVCNLLRDIKANLPRQTGGIPSGSMNLGGAVPLDLQIWQTPYGVPSY